MGVEPRALATIVGMALVTYATRAGGFWLLGQVAPSRAVRRWLGELPGAILVALAAPAVLAAGPPGAVAGALTVAVAARTGNVALAMITGVVAIRVLRSFG